MKKSVRIICAVLAFLVITATFPGCAAMSLNEEKDAESVVAVINGEKIPKSEFNDYVKFNTLVYELYGYVITEDYEADFKEALYKDFINTYLFKNELEKAGVEITQEEIDLSKSELMDMVNIYAPDEASKAAMYEKFGLDEASFAALIDKEIAFTYYATKYDSSEMDKSFVTEAYAMKVGGVEIPNYIFYYYAVMVQLENYLYQNEYASSEAEYLVLYDTVAERLKNAQAIISYCEKNGVEITEDEIASSRLSLETIEYYVGSNSMQQMYDGYYLTNEQVEAGKIYMARATAYQTKLEAQVVEGINPSEKELQKYMQDNIASYDESTVSAYHILVADKTAATALEEEAGGTPEGFMTVYEKYKGNSTILEAADLGAFKRTDMVDPFSDAAFDMQIGEVKGSVQTDYGYHLIYVYDKKSVEVPSYEQIAEQVRTDYIESKADEEVNAFFEKVTDVKIKNKNYKQMPGTLLTEMLYDIYNVKTKLKTALR